MVSRAPTAVGWTKRFYGTGSRPVMDCFSDTAAPAQTTRVVCNYARAQGRNRFYRLASPEVAHAIESLMALAGQRAAPASKTAAWRRDPDLRFCRTCYDHLAGQVGIAVTDSLTQHGHLEPKGPRDWKLTNSGELFCHRIGVDLAGARRAGSRHFARHCLDWSERRPHISGALGAAIADTFFKKGWAERLRRGRTVRLTDSGRRALGSHFGASV